MALFFGFLCERRFFVFPLRKTGVGVSPGGEGLTMKASFLERDEFFGDGKVGLRFFDAWKQKWLAFRLVFRRRIV